MTAKSLKIEKNEDFIFFFQRQRNNDRSGCHQFAVYIEKEQILSYFRSVISKNCQFKLTVYYPLKT